MRRPPPLPLPVRALLFQHLAAMEKAGLPAERAYALLQLGAAAAERVGAFRRQFAKGVDPVSAGFSCGLFNVFETRLLRAAFCGGSPYPTYQRLARSLATRAAHLKTLRTRLVLPAAVLAIALCVQPLPALFSGAITGAGYLLRALGPLVAIGVAATLALRVNAWFASGAPSPSRPALERALLSLPLFGAIHLRRNARDFCESLALLLGAGLALFEAVPVAADTVDNHIVRDDVASILPALRGGATLAQAVAGLRVVDTVQLLAIVHTGEQSGSLPEMLMRHADAESAALAQTQSEMMAWLPRILYGCVALWMAAQLLRPAL